MKKTIFAASIVTVALMTGCSSAQKTDDTTAAPAATSSSSSEFTRFQSDRPEEKSLAIGEASVDATFNSVAGIYAQTVGLTDAYISRVESAPTFKKMAALKESQGQAVYDAEVAKLTAAEKAEYDQYLDSSTDITKGAIALLAQAYKLQQSVTAVDVKAFVKNPMKVPGALKAASLATDQISFSVDSLEMLKKYHDIYSNAMSYQGR